MQARARPSSTTCIDGVKTQRCVPNAYARTGHHKSRTHAVVIVRGRLARIHESLDDGSYTAETYHTTTTEVECSPRQEHMAAEHSNSNRNGRHHRTDVPSICPPPPPLSKRAIRQQRTKEPSVYGPRAKASLRTLHKARGLLGTQLLRVAVSALRSNLN